MLIGIRSTSIYARCYWKYIYPCTLELEVHRSMDFVVISTTYAHCYQKYIHLCTLLLEVLPMHIDIRSTRSMYFGIRSTLQIHIKMRNTFAYAHLFQKYIYLCSFQKDIYLFTFLEGHLPTTYVFRRTSTYIRFQKDLCTLVFKFH